MYSRGRARLPWWQGMSVIPYTPMSPLTIPSLESLPPVYTPPVPDLPTRTTSSSSDDNRWRDSHPYTPLYPHHKHPLMCPVFHPRPLALHSIYYWVVGRQSGLLPRGHKEDGWPDILWGVKGQLTCRGRGERLKHFKTTVCQKHLIAELLMWGQRRVWDRQRGLIPRPRGEPDTGRDEITGVDIFH